MGVTSVECKISYSMGHSLAIASRVDSTAVQAARDRLNTGPIQTNQISWEQPREGNLFEHQYARRSFPQAADARLAATADA